MRADKKRVSLDSPAMRRIKETLSHARKPLDGETIARRSYVGVRTFGNGYQQLLIEAGLIHVAEWRRSARGPFTPLFSFGPGEPAPKPPRLTDAEVSKRWKEKTGYDELRKLGRQLARPHDRMLAALMGVPSRGRHFKEHHNKPAML